MTAAPPATIDRHTGYPAAHSRQQATVLEGSMIKDVMVHLDGTYADDVRFAAAVDLAEKFDSHIIGLLLVVIPAIAPADPLGALDIINLREAARKEGDDAEAKLRERISKLNPGSELRRIDVAGDTRAPVAAREARTADAFVAIRPNGEPRDPEQLIEGVLFGSGRHVYVVPESAPSAHVFNHVLLAWNGSREAARALAEGMPYFRHAQKVTVLMVIDDPADENQAKLGHEVVRHLLHHGIHATPHHSKREMGRVGETLIAEAERLKADLLVMGAYGTSRLREWLLRGTTYKILHESPIPLLMSH
jgi:nucleotide-binding universal stress UspA family protein